MANNIDVTPGAGKTVAGEEIAGILFQRVKLIDATLTSTDPTGVAASPLQVSLANTGANGTPVAVSGTVAVSSVTTAVVPGTGATNLGKAEDAAHTSGDVGVFALAVQKATPADLAADGDYAALEVSAGRLWVSESEVLVDDAAFTVATSKVAAIGLMADESSPDSVDEGDIGIPRMTLDRKALVAAQPTTSGGLLVANMTSGDGSSVLTNTAQAIKASAGQLYGWYIYNPNSSAVYIPIYNVAAASVTVGTTNPQMVLVIPAASAANILGAVGIEFNNAGWSAAATTSGGGSGAPAIGVEATFFYK